MAATPAAERHDATHLAAVRTGTIPNRNHGGPKMPSQVDARSSGDKAQRGVTLMALGFLVGMGVVSVILALSTPAEADVPGLGVGITAFALFMAAAAVGAALGFMFGLPRARFAERLTASELDKGADQGATPQPPASTHFLANSNLIKVSDWLTTIIIGLGLVNLGGFLPAIGALSAVLKEPLGGEPYSGALGVSIIIAGCLVGFLLVYLWTTLRFRELMEESERQFERKGVPTLEGLTVQQAREALGATSLELVTDMDAPDDATVVSQSLEPGAIVPRGSTVRINVSPADSAADSDPR